MSSVLVVIIAFVTFGVAYYFYAPKIERLWEIDTRRPTPAVSKCDGIDYVPAKHWLVLFGHHFSSIAGAGPIIGPTIACYLWGWGPSLAWIILGSIFFGGIHDFGALITSVREDGATINEIAEKSVSRNAKIILSVFTWLALILVVAVFAYLGANTFVTQPKVVIPSLGMIPVAILTGIALYRLKYNHIVVTIIGITALGGLVMLGERFPVAIGKNAQQIWIIALFIYCYCASIMPVNILLQPRDYLSSFLLFGGIALALLGIFVSRPILHTQTAFLGTSSTIGFLWPMMFITIACGANSGFHSLVSSGTTSKQIPNERYAKRIGFGGMLLEGFLAVIVVIVVIAGFNMVEFNAHIANKTSPVQIYGAGFGAVTERLIGPWGNFIALTILNIFILTTLDSATRITRYITEELFAIKNRYVSTAIIVVIGGYLALSKDSANNPLWQKIWPAFGASNQLVAALALLVLSCWLLQKGKPTRYALIPSLFMLITSITALGIQIIGYSKNREYLLIAVSSVLIISALYVVKEVWNAFKRGQHYV